MQHAVSAPAGSGLRSQRPSRQLQHTRAAPLRATPPSRRRGPRAACVSGVVAAAPALLAAAPLYAVGDLSTTLFALGQQADALVNANLTNVTPATYAVVLVRVACAHPQRHDPG